MAKKTAVLCVGNRLMLDDGVGPAVFDRLTEAYLLPPEVKLVDCGCLSLAFVSFVRDFDCLITVDAVDGTREPVGSVLRYAPSDIARRSMANASLHDLKLADLFDAAALLGYEAEGICFGMQIENASPALATEGLTPKVFASLDALTEAVVAQLIARGHEVRRRDV